MSGNERYAKEQKIGKIVDLETIKKVFENCHDQLVEAYMYSDYGKVLVDEMKKHVSGTLDELLDLQVENMKSSEED